MGKYQSGQMGQTVNLLAYAFGGSNPSLPTNVLKKGMQTSLDGVHTFETVSVCLQILCVNVLRK